MSGSRSRNAPGARFVPPGIRRQSTAVHPPAPPGPDRATSVARSTEPAEGASSVGGRSLAALPALLTMVEVADVLRTSRKAVYAMAERGQLAGLTRIGRRLLVRRDDLLCWLDERRAASPGGSRR
jgi:excisionase family DNA binding protein